jgi:hypothetical protein
MTTQQVQLTIPEQGSASLVQTTVAKYAAEAKRAEEALIA